MTDSQKSNSFKLPEKRTLCPGCESVNTIEMTGGYPERGIGIKRCKDCLTMFTNCLKCDKLVNLGAILEEGAFGEKISLVRDFAVRHPNCKILEERANNGEAAILVPNNSQDAWYNFKKENSAWGAYSFEEGICPSCNEKHYFEVYSITEE